MTDGQIGVFCGERQVLHNFQRLIDETHRRHLIHEEEERIATLNQKPVVDKTS
jgi:hypothetical protein